MMMLQLKTTLALLCSDLEDLWQWALENYFNSPQNLYIVEVNRNLRPIKLVKQGPAHPAGHRRSIDISRRLPNSRMSTIDGYKIHWTTNHKLNLNGDFQVIKVHLKYSIIYYFHYYYSKIDIKVSSTIYNNIPDPELQGTMKMWHKSMGI